MRRGAQYKPAKACAGVGCSLLLLARCCCSCCLRRSSVARMRGIPHFAERARGELARWQHRPGACACVPRLRIAGGPSMLLWNNTRSPSLDAKPYYSGGQQRRPFPLVTPGQAGIEVIGDKFRTSSTSLPWGPGSAVRPISPRLRKDHAPRACSGLMYAPHAAGPCTDCALTGSASSDGLAVGYAGGLGTSLVRGEPPSGRAARSARRTVPLTPTAP